MTWEHILILDSLLLVRMFQPISHQSLLANIQWSPGGLKKDQSKADGWLSEDVKLDSSIY